LFNPDLSLGRYTLSPEESHHAVKVLRVRVGREVILFDGVGGEASATVVRVDRGRVRVNVLHVERHDREDAVALTLAVAPPRTHRQTYMIEKCTELGADAFRPIVTERGVVRLATGIVEKWSRHVVEACKQCGRRWLPDVLPPQRFLDTLERIGDFDCALIAQPGPASQPLVHVLTDRRRADSLLVWIGPEGGWTPVEIEAALCAGAVPTHLGKTRLRTETAAVAVTAVVKSQLTIDNRGT